VNFGDCRADHTGQEKAKHAKAENQPPSDVQLQKCHGEVPPDAGSRQASSKDTLSVNHEDWNNA
jgi:hypothetical protein